MNIILKRKGSRGFIGLALLTITLIMVAIASVVLFNFFYLFFRIGLSTEAMSTDYESLSSGIYYAIAMIDGGETLPATHDIYSISIPVSYNATSHVITAGPLAGSGRTIVAEYENGVILSWN
jgi:archaellin